jgi:type II secretory pathway component GspD/PulD (secretin)
MAQFSSKPGKLLRLSLSLMLVAQGCLPPVFAANQDVLTGDIRVTVSPANIQALMPISGANRKVTMSFRDVEIQDALRALAKKGSFNVLIDESVKGAVSVDLNDVTIQDALETLKTYGHLAYSSQGGNLMVADADSDKGQSFMKTSTRVINLRYANAKIMADLLNKTVFADRAGTSGGQSGSSQSGLPVTPDSHTNSLIVVGTPEDIRTVREHVEALDQPREMRTWRLNQANVLDVASILSSSLFNEGQPALIVGSSGGGGASSGSGGGQPSSMRVTAEKIEEGTGATQASQASGSSGGSSTSVVNSMTLRGRVKESQTVQISPNGAILIPDTRLNTLTLLGTAEQISMAEAMIPTLDRKVPQVILEAALVEITEDGRKELGFSSAGNNGHWSSGTNTGGSRLINQAFSNAIGRTTSSTTPLESLFRYNTNPTSEMRDWVYQLNALMHRNKAKLLAHPTVVTSSDNEAIISIVDEILRSVSLTQGTNGGAPTVTHNFGEAGIVLNILPKVGANGTISLRVRPVISTIAGTQVSLGNTVTLLAKREVLAQSASVRDGETFVLAGLIHDTNTDSVTRNPMLANLPIVGALARNSTKSRHKSELVIMITPHIINDESEVTRFAKVPGSQLVPTSLAQARRQAGIAGGSEPGMIPVSLGGPARPSALPPMGQVHVIGQPAARNSSLELKPAARKDRIGGSGSQPGSMPSAMHGSLRADDLAPAPDITHRSADGKIVGAAAPAGEAERIGPTLPPARPKAPTKPVVIARPATGSDISDSAIQAIMDKFK